jgi:hypothetical protein
MARLISIGLAFFPHPYFWGFARLVYGFDDDLRI